jgi:selenocysteine-specific elongation factor
VQVHGEAAEKAVAGQRTALNLAGASTEDLARGMMLAPPKTFQSTKRVDVSLSLLPSAKPLKERARVHLHAYTSETIAEVRLHAGKQIAPGAIGYAQLRMDDPALLLPGDRFILRQFSPVVTIGGGVVLDAAPMPKAKREKAPAVLEIFAAGNPQSTLEARVARRLDQGLTVAQAVAETGWRKSTIERHVAPALAQRTMLRVGELLVNVAVLEDVKSAAMNTVSEFHKRNPLVPGISKQELQDTLTASAGVFEAALASLVTEKKLDVSGELVHLSGRGVVMKDEEAESKKTIEAAFASAGLQAPALHQVIAGLKVDKMRAQKIVTLLLRDKVLIKISDELVFHRAALDDLRRKMKAYKSKSPQIDVGAFKELTGVSRKYAIPLLEYLDRERITRRVGDARVIL